MYSAFKRAELAVVPCAVREAMEGEHIPETGLTSFHQLFQEGGKFESSILRLDRCCLLVLLRVVAGFLECTEIACAFGQICLPGREAKFQSHCLIMGFNVPWA